MIDDLIGFKEALKAQTMKAIMPTELSHAEIQQIDSGLLERSLFSAKTANVNYLQELRDVIQRVLAPKTVTKEDGTKVVRGMNIAEARTRLMNLFPTVHGDGRTNLILDTQLGMSWGRGYHQKGQDSVILSSWPCWELFRAEDRVEPRDWPARWEQAGGTFYPGDSDYPDFGRMIARKDDTIWVDISDFGLPYPPFALNSGMILRQIDRDEAVDLGVIEEGEEVKPSDEPDDDLEAPAELDAEMQGAILEDLGDEYEFEDGVLRKTS